VNKPLIAVAGFTVLAAGVLVYFGTAYARARAEAAADRAAWRETEQLRSRLAATRQQFDALGVALPPRTAVDVPALLGELIKECGIDVNQMKVDADRPGAREQSRHRVHFLNVRLDVMGTLLEKIKTKHRSLEVRDIRMQAVADHPAEFIWDLEIASLSPQKAAD